MRDGPPRVHVFADPDEPLNDGERMCDDPDYEEVVVYHAGSVPVGNEWLCELCGELTGGGEA